ncbi:MAG: hypothetical protein KatS3mg121_0126 [Gammaproteobacteria bacterium]|nr:MAG: hypothetical protein KatS3mg121_0126 [Gammaproteobacteria bacterium]
MSRRPPADDWTAAFPGLAALSPPLRARLLEQGRLRHWPAGARLFGAGAPLPGPLFLLEGTLKVVQYAESSREIVLFRVPAGDSCVMSSACVLAENPLGAEGVAETALRGALLEAPVFDALLAESAEFRRFVLRAQARRLAALFQVVDALLSSRLEVRLARCLLDEADGQGWVRATHRRLAAELGSAREAVSRRLNAFARQGWIEQGRGRLRLRDRAALLRLAAGAALD